MLSVYTRHSQKCPHAHFGLAGVLRKQGKTAEAAEQDARVPKATGRVETKPRTTVKTNKKSYQVSPPPAGGHAPNVRRSIAIWPM
jgi:hypothetical protein